ncbi:hypothetical protein HK098_005247 [Nowakowskiella sp. JEL0407]|nr:hypothetical protein HK098_005247 [Nowakowskiella sp. JEL0407]
MEEMTGLGITVPIERAISFPYIVLLAAESVIGFMTVRKVVKSQAALFMLKLQDCDDEEFEENAVSYLKYIPPTGDPQSTTTAWAPIPKVKLPADVQKVKDSLVGKITRDPTKRLAVTNFPDFISGPIRFSQIDINSTPQNPLTFALKQFQIPAKASTTSQQLRDKIQNSLNVYLADEVAVRESSDKKVTATLQKVKVVKFFLQFQVARIAGDKAEIEHQRGKVLKNAAGAPSADLNTVKSLQ